MEKRWRVNPDCFTVCGFNLLSLVRMPNCLLQGTTMLDIDQLWLACTQSLRNIEINKNSPQIIRSRVYQDSFSFNFIGSYLCPLPDSSECWLQAIGHLQWWFLQVKSNSCSPRIWWVHQLLQEKEICNEGGREDQPLRRRLIMYLVIFINQTIIFKSSINYQRKKGREIFTLPQWL